MKIKILIIIDENNLLENKYQNYSFAKLLIDKIKEKCEVEIFDPYKNFINLGFENFNRTIFEKSKDFNIIILFQTWFFGFKHNLFNQIKNENLSIKNFCIDLESNEMLFIYYAKLLENFDLVFCSDSILAERIYGSLNINSKFLPFVFSDKHYYPPLNSTDKLYDSSFIGQKHSSRAYYINHLLKNDCKVSTFGAYNQDYISWSDIIKIYYSTKINLYFSEQKRRKEKIFDLTMSHNMKSSLLHFAMTKSFFLIEHSYEHEKILGEFKFLTFKNKDELLSKYQFYLNNQLARDALVEKIYKKIGIFYSFENYYMNFIDLIFNNAQPVRLKNKHQISKAYQINLLGLKKIKLYNKFFIINNLSQINKIKNIQLKIKSFIDFFIYCFSFLKIKS